MINISGLSTTEMSFQEKEAPILMVLKPSGRLLKEDWQNSMGSRRTSNSTSKSVSGDGIKPTFNYRSNYSATLESVID
jgi:hypothetical protein